MLRPDATQVLLGVGAPPGEERLHAQLEIAGRADLSGPGEAEERDASPAHRELPHRLEPRSVRGEGGQEGTGVPGKVRRQVSETLPAQGPRKRSVPEDQPGDVLPLE